METPSSVPEQTPTPTPEQPMSVHGHSKVNVPVIAAAIGLPLLAGLIILSLFMLPKLGHGPSQSQPTGSSTSDQESSGTSSGEENTNPTNVQSAMNKYTVADAEARKGLCNDGTPAIYYFRPGTTDHADDWIIHLHGGGHCSTDAGCAQRAQANPQYVSSKSYPATLKTDGIFSTSPSDNPDFYNWNQVQIEYCSSDVWSGTKDGTVAGETWHFYGNYIISDVIEDLQNPDIIHTSTLADASRLIFTGSSAGGVGASINLDRVAEMLPNVEVKGLIDSAFTFPVERYSETNVDAQIDVALATNFQGRKYDETCLAANTDPSACANMLGMYPYFETPVYVFSYQRDPVLMQNTAGVTNLKDPAQLEYLDNVYTPTYMANIASIDPVFSPNEVMHTAAMSDRFYTTKIRGTSFAQAFGDWYFGRGDTTRYIE